MLSGYGIAPAKGLSDLLRGQKSSERLLELEEEINELCKTSVSTVFEDNLFLLQGDDAEVREHLPVLRNLLEKAKKKLELEERPCAPQEASA